MECTDFDFWAQGAEKKRRWPAAGLHDNDECWASGRGSFARAVRESHVPSRNASFSNRPVLPERCRLGEKPKQRRQEAARRRARAPAEARVTGT